MWAAGVALLELELELELALELALELHPLGARLMAPVPSAGLSSWARARAWPVAAAAPGK